MQQRRLFCHKEVHNYCVTVIENICFISPLPALHLNHKSIVYFWKNNWMPHKACLFPIHFHGKITLKNFTDSLALWSSESLGLP